jgi:hypothetical protein
MFFTSSQVFSVGEICRSYPNEWVAIAVAETDADGFAVSGEIISHDTEERFVWPAVRLGEIENPVYVFFTGAVRKSSFAA